MEIDVIVTSHTTPTFNMVDINLKQHGTFMATPTLKSNAGGMQEKESIMVVWCGQKILSLGSIVWHHSAKPRDAEQ